MGGGMPPQPPQGGPAALGQLAKKPSTPDSGAPLLQMIMAMLAGAGFGEVTKSLSSLMKLGQPSKATGMQHAKQPGSPPGMQPSKPGQSPMPPTGPQPPQGGPQGAPANPAQGLDIQKLLAMLLGGGQQQPPQA